MVEVTVAEIKALSIEDTKQYLPQIETSVRAGFLSPAGDYVEGKFD